MDKPIVIIYVEGGHRDDETLDDDFQLDNANFRRSITIFIEKALPNCEANRYKLVVNVCGGRDETIKRFSNDVENQTVRKKTRGKVAKVLRVLLVDSEGAVGKRSCKAHLNRQAGTKLGRNVKERQVFLMVQCMEALFLTDPNGLQAYYRRQSLNFDRQTLALEVTKAKGGDPSVSIEQIPKSDRRVVHGGVQVSNIPAHIISKAIQGSDYRKSDGFELFGFIDPDLVSTASPHCEDFVNAMRTLLC